ncbi:hypothetical protein ACQEUU_04680 [Nonomuraea sp. CA-218870]|uniref:hypothetical protein n=1 Tax=Nonomuraea sp. CA-218870 TaxID=3239998 RepID=UPI003D8DCE37
MNEEQAPEERERPSEPSPQADTSSEDAPASPEDDFDSLSPEDQEEHRRFRLSGLASGGAFYGVSGQGANVAVAGAQYNYQQFNVNARPTRLVTPLTPERVCAIRDCTVTTVSRAQLADRLPHNLVMSLKGSPESGRRTTAYAALLDWIGDQEDPSLALINGDVALSELTSKDLAGARGLVLEPSDDDWAGASHEMLAHLRSIAYEADCRIVVLLARTGTGGESLVVHDPPLPTDVFRAWIEYRLGGSHAWKREGFDAHEPQLTEMLDGCSPGWAEERAQEVVYGLRRGLQLDELLESLEKPVRERLQQAFAARDLKESSFSRCFLISSGVFHDLTEPIASRAALRLEELIRGQENERTRPGPPVWEPLQSLLVYEGMRTEPRLVPGDGHRIRLRRDVREQVLQVAWEEVPALRGILHEWLREFTNHKDARVATRAAQAVAQLAVCDFDGVKSEFLEPWSEAGYGGSYLAKATLEAAWSLNPDLAQRTHWLLENWSRGNYRRRMTAAIAYGSQIGVQAIDKALPSFKRVVQHSLSNHLHALVAGAIAEVYVETTAEQILRELRGWTTSDSYGLRRTSALAPGRLACLPPEVFPGRLALAENTMHGEVAALLCHALDCSRPAPSGPDRRTPPVWDLLARWAGETRCQRVMEEIFTMVGTHYRHLRMPLLFHLRAWRAKGIVTAERRLVLHDMLKRGGHPCSG